jgi:AcrR family transcriptional regulator
MPRSRTTSNPEILDAVTRVVSRVGPARLTLADVAAEAGLAAPTLLQRFGSKRGLLLEVARHGADRLPEQFGRARQAQASPLEALLQALAESAAALRTPEEVSNHLAFLQMDLSDPEFHVFALEHAVAMRKEIAALLHEAISAGELSGCDAENLARTVQTAYNGALVTWAIFREGPLDVWIRGEADEVLAPYARVG